MDRYQNYSLEEFVWDESFRNWVLKPTREDNEKWKNWLVENPDKELLLCRAAEIVQAVAPGAVFLPASEKREAIQNIMDNLPASETNILQAAKPYFTIQKWMQIAAVLLLFAGLGWSALKLRHPKSTNYEELVSGAGATLTEKHNTTGKPVSVALSDGSTVRLNPGSKISYPARFAGNRREVYLSGEAFFDIARYPSMPFFVYANEVVTKVLGTSFFVRSYANEKEVSVRVKTGRVAVFTRNDQDINDKLSTKELAGVVIEPNQQIVFVRETVKITKSLIPKPEIVEEKNTYNFNFDEVPVATVFAVLQKAYGIEIIYDKNLMNDCPITATLTEMTLFEKLDLVCKAVGATYELIDGRVIIEGKDCKI